MAETSASKISRFCDQLDPLDQNQKDLYTLIDFGTVNIGNRATAEYTVLNYTNDLQRYKVKRQRGTGELRCVYSFEKTCFTLRPASGRKLKIRFTPIKNFHTYIDYVFICDNNGVSTKICLRGKCIGPYIAARNTEITLKTTISTEAEQIIELRNYSAAPSEFYFEVDNENSVFKFFPVRCKMKGEATVAITVQFHPPFEGTFEKHVFCMIDHQTPIRFHVVGMCARHINADTTPQLKRFPGLGPVSESRNTLDAYIHREWEGIVEITPQQPIIITPKELFTTFKVVNKRETTFVLLWVQDSQKRFIITPSLCRLFPKRTTKFKAQFNSMIYQKEGNLRGYNIPPGIGATSLMAGDSALSSVIDGWLFWESAEHMLSSVHEPWRKSQCYSEDKWLSSSLPINVELNLIGQYAKEEKSHSPICCKAVPDIVNFRNKCCTAHSYSAFLIKSSSRNKVSYKIIPPKCTEYLAKPMKGVVNDEFQVIVVCHIPKFNHLTSEEIWHIALDGGKIGMVDLMLTTTECPLNVLFGEEGDCVMFPPVILGCFQKKEVMVHNKSAFWVQISYDSDGISSALNLGPSICLVAPNEKIHLSWKFKPNRFGLNSEMIVYRAREIRDPEVEGLMGKVKKCAESRHNGIEKEIQEITDVGDDFTSLECQVKLFEITAHIFCRNIIPVMEPTHLLITNFMMTEPAFGTFLLLNPGDAPIPCSLYLQHEPLHDESLDSNVDPSQRVDESLFQIIPDHGILNPSESSKFQCTIFSQDIDPHRYSVVMEITKSGEEDNLLEKAAHTTPPRKLGNITCNGAWPRVEITDVRSTINDKFYNHILLWKCFNVDGFNEALEFNFPAQSKTVDMTFPERPMNSQPYVYNLKMKNMSPIRVKWKFKLVHNKLGMPLLLTTTQDEKDAHGSICTDSTMEGIHLLKELIQIQQQKALDYQDDSHLGSIECCSKSEGPQWTASGRRVVPKKCPLSYIISVVPEEGFMMPGDEETLKISVRHELEGKFVLHYTVTMEVADGNNGNAAEEGSSRYNGNSTELPCNGENHGMSFNEHSVICGTSEEMPSEAKREKMLKDLGKSTGAIPKKRIPHSDQESAPHHTDKHSSAEFWYNKLLFDERNSFDMEHKQPAMLRMRKHNDDYFEEPDSYHPPSTALQSSGYSELAMCIGGGTEYTHMNSLDENKYYDDGRGISEGKECESFYEFGHALGSSHGKNVGLTTPCPSVMGSLSMGSPNFIPDSTTAESASTLCQTSIKESQFEVLNSVSVYEGDHLTKDVVKGMLPKYISTPRPISYGSGDEGSTTTVQSVVPSNSKAKAAAQPQTKDKLHLVELYKSYREMNSKKYNNKARPEKVLGDRGVTRQSIQEKGHYVTVIKKRGPERKREKSELLFQYRSAMGSVRFSPRTLQLVEDQYFLTHEEEAPTHNHHSTLSTAEEGEFERKDLVLSSNNSENTSGSNRMRYGSGFISHDPRSGTLDKAEHDAAIWDDKKNQISYLSQCSDGSYSNSAETWNVLEINSTAGKTYRKGSGLQLFETNNETDSDRRHVSEEDYCDLEPLCSVPSFHLPGPPQNSVYPLGHWPHSSNKELPEDLHLPLTDSEVELYTYTAYSTPRTRLQSWPDLTENKFDDTTEYIRRLSLDELNIASQRNYEGQFDISWENDDFECLCKSRKVSGGRAFSLDDLNITSRTSYGEQSDRSSENDGFERTYTLSQVSDDRGTTDVSVTTSKDSGASSKGHKYSFDDPNITSRTSYEEELNRSLEKDGFGRTYTLSQVSDDRGTTDVPVTTSKKSCTPSNESSSSSKKTSSSSKESTESTNESMEFQVIRELSPLEGRAKEIMISDQKHIIRRKRLGINSKNRYSQSLTWKRWVFRDEMLARGAADCTRCGSETLKLMVSKIWSKHQPQTFSLPRCSGQSDTTLNDIGISTPSTASNEQLDYLECSPSTMDSEGRRVRFGEEELQNVCTQLSTPQRKLKGRMRRKLKKKKKKQRRRVVVTPLKRRKRKKIRSKKKGKMKSKKKGKKKDNKKKKDKKKEKDKKKNKKDKKKEKDKKKKDKDKKKKRNDKMEKRKDKKKSENKSEKNKKSKRRNKKNQKRKHHNKRKHKKHRKHPRNKKYQKHRKHKKPQRNKKCHRRQKHRKHQQHKMHWKHVKFQRNKKHQNHPKQKYQWQVMLDMLKKKDIKLWKNVRWTWMRLNKNNTKPVVKKRVTRHKPKKIRHNCKFPKRRKKVNIFKNIRQKALKTMKCIGLEASSGVNGNGIMESYELHRNESYIREYEGLYLEPMQFNSDFYYELVSKLKRLALSEVPGRVGLFDSTQCRSVDNNALENDQMIYYQMRLKTYDLPDETEGSKFGQCGKGEYALKESRRVSVEHKQDIDLILSNLIVLETEDGTTHDPISHQRDSFSALSVSSRQSCQQSGIHHSSDVLIPIVMEKLGKRKLWEKSRVAIANTVEVKFIICSYDETKEEPSIHPTTYSDRITLADVCIGDLSSPYQVTWLYNPHEIYTFPYNVESITDFYFDQKKIFKCMNQTGVIYPKSMHPLVIQFQPQEVGLYKGYIHFKYGEKDVIMQIEGKGIQERAAEFHSIQPDAPTIGLFEDPESPFLLSDERITITEFIPMGSKALRLIFIVNTRNKAIYFHWETMISSLILNSFVDVSVEPSHGILSPYEVLPLLISISKAANRFRPLELGEGKERGQKRQCCTMHQNQMGNDTCLLNNGQLCQHHLQLGSNDQSSPRLTESGILKDIDINSPLIIEWYPLICEVTCVEEYKLGGEDIDSQKFKKSIKTYNKPLTISFGMCSNNSWEHDMDINEVSSHPQRDESVPTHHCVVQGNQHVSQADALWELDEESLKNTIGDLLEGITWNLLNNSWLSNVLERAYMEDSLEDTQIMSKKTSRFKNCSLQLVQHESPLNVDNRVSARPKNRTADVQHESDLDNAAMRMISLQSTPSMLHGNVTTNNEEEQEILPNSVPQGLAIRFFEDSIVRNVFSSIINIFDVSTDLERNGIDLSDEN